MAGDIEGTETAKPLYSCRICIFVPPFSQMLLVLKTTFNKTVKVKKKKRYFTAPGSPST